MKLKLTCFLLLLILIYPSYSQKENFNWYFGYGAGITFMPGGSKPVVLTDGKTNTYEGASTVSDKDGKLLFYTDGCSVWNRNHEIMLNGTGLLGHNSSTQSSLIVPKPGDNNIYYIFTTDAFENYGDNGLCYSIVDMSKNSGLGVVTIKNTRLIPSCSEKLAACIGQGGNFYWILAHDFYSKDFYAFKLTKDSLFSKPVITSIGTDYSEESGNSVGQLKFSSDTKKVATAIYGRGLIETFDFDNSTGVLSNNEIIYDLHKLSLTYRNPYGIEFSPDGSRLYCSILSPVAILQFKSAIGSGKFLLTRIDSSFSGSVGQMQIAPDNRIYLAIHDQDYLGVINKPDLDYPDCSITERGIDLKEKLSAYGLPNFVARPTGCRIGVHFYSGSITLCEGDTIKLQAMTDFDGDYKYIWSTGDTTDFIYVSKKGVYSVIVSAGPECRDTARTVVTVSPIPAADIITEGDTVICEGDSVVLTSKSFDPNNCKYEWSNGGTARSITVKESGRYSLKITNNDGCTDSAEVNIEVFQKPVAEITADGDTVFCKGDSIRLYAKPDIKDFTYKWSNGMTTPSILVADSGTYKVIISNKAGCADSAEINIISYPGVEASIEVIGNTSFCKGENVELIAKPYSKKYSYKWSNGCPTQAITASDSGIYSVIITNEYGCTDTAYVTLKLYPAIKASIATEGGKKSICTGETLELTAEPAGADLSYEWSNGQAGKSITVSQSGYYSVTVASQAGCKDTAGVYIEVAPSVEIKADTAYASIGDSNTIIKARVRMPGGNASQHLIFSAEIVLDASVFLPKDMQPDTRRNYIDTDGFRHMLIEDADLNLDDKQEAVYSIKGISLLGRELRSIIYIRNVLTQNRKTCLDTAKGLLVLDSVCAFKSRQIKSGGLKTAALEIAPNPSGGETEIKASYQETGAYQLEIYAVEGKSSFSNQWINGTDKPQERRFNIELSAYPAGIYYAVLRSPSGTVARKMVVVR